VLSLPRLSFHTLPTRSRAPDPVGFNPTGGLVLTSRLEAEIRDSFWLPRTTRAGGSAVLAAAAFDVDRTALALCVGPDQNDERGSE
jgi:hypothetical protein